MTANLINKTYDIKSDNLQCHLKAEVNADFFKSVYENKLREISKGFKLPGFRPGKVPKGLLDARYGAAIVKESAEEVVEKSLGEILEKEKLQVASQPKLDLQKVEVGSGLVYSAEFESMPTIEDIDFEKLKIEQPVVELSEKDLEDIAQEQIKRSPNWAETKKAIKDGDKVKVDFDGKVDGKAFEGGAGKDIEIIVGEGKFLKDFEKGIVGVKSGNNCQLNVQFPDDYHQDKLAGKLAVFEVKVSEVWEPKYFKLDEKWFKNCGSKATNKKEFLEEVGKKEQVIADRMAKKITSNRISEALTKMLKFPVPQSLMDSELKGATETGKALKEKTEKAKSNIQYILLMQKMIQDFKVDASPAELELYLESLIPAGVDMQFFKSWYVQDKSRIEKIRMAVLEEKVLDQVKNLCKLKDVKMTLADARKLIEKEK